MNIAELFKKNFVLVPVRASVLFGTFTGVKYVVNLTDTINANQLAIIKIQEVEIKDLRRDLAYEQEKMADVKTRLASAEATWTMAENLYNVLANTVREQGYDIKDVARDLLNDYQVMYGDSQDGLQVYCTINYNDNNVSFVWWTSKF